MEFASALLIFLKFSSLKLQLSPLIFCFSIVVQRICCFVETKMTQYSHFCYCIWRILIWPCFFTFFIRYGAIWSLKLNQKATHGIFMAEHDSISALLLRTGKFLEMLPEKSCLIWKFLLTTDGWFEILIDKSISTFVTDTRQMVWNFKWNIMFWSENSYWKLTDVLKF